MLRQISALSVGSEENMDIFICDSCGNEFNIECEGNVECPQCGKIHTVTLRKKKEETAETTAENNNEEGFSLSRLRSNILENYEADLASQEPAKEKAPAQELPIAQPVSEKSEKKKKEKQPRPVSPAKQARMDKKNVKKQKKRDKKQAKEDKRNAKISRQLNRNTNKFMFVVCILLSGLCCALFFMYKNNLSFFDLPEVLGGSGSGKEKTTIAVNINEQIPGLPAEPPAGPYIVIAAAGVAVYEEATDNSVYITAMTEGTKLDVKAFKYDKDSQQYWGRIKMGNTYGWVPMNGLQQTTADPVTTAPTAEAIG